MAALNPTVTIPVDPDFINNLKKFMAVVQKYQGDMQRQFQQRMAVQQILRGPQLPNMLIRVIVNVRKITKHLEKIMNNIDRITDRLINNSMGVFGRAFMGAMSAVMPFLETLIPIVEFMAGPIGWVISAATFIYTIGKYAIRFMRWLFDKTVGLGESMMKDWSLASGTGTTVSG